MGNMCWTVLVRILMQSKHIEDNMYNAKAQIWNVEKYVVKVNVKLVLAIMIKLLRVEHS